MAHVLSRGNRRATVFHSETEYADFIRLLDEASREHALDVYAFCVMPNHFHLVARFDEAVQLSTFMQAWLTRHVRRHHQRNGTAGHGHIWQDRFKSFQIQQDLHLLTVLRYVLMNPVRARLVESPWGWRWSSLWFDPMLSSWPVAPPVPLRNWLELPNDEDEDARLRRSIRRNAPFGDEAWEHATAEANGASSTLKALGRPRIIRPMYRPEEVALF